MFCDRCRSNLRHRAKAVLGHRKRRNGKRRKSGQTSGDDGEGLEEEEEEESGIKRASSCVWPLLSLSAFLVTSSCPLLPLLPRSVQTVHCWQPANLHKRCACLSYPCACKTGLMCCCVATHRAAGSGSGCSCGRSRARGTVLEFTHLLPLPPPTRCTPPLFWALVAQCLRAVCGVCVCTSASVPPCPCVCVLKYAPCACVCMCVYVCVLP